MLFKCEGCNKEVAIIFSCVNGKKLCTNCLYEFQQKLARKGEGHNKGKPDRVDGVLVFADGYLDKNFRCPNCGTGLSCVVGIFGAEICRRCAKYFATDESKLGWVFHTHDIVWRDDCDWYATCPSRLHPLDEKCEYCEEE